MHNELLSQIKRIKIFTKRLVASSLSGDYLSAFKGMGMEFHQIREYQLGDDVRSIDWNNSVKSQKLMVKQFIEERDRTIILMIDVSPSGLYSSNSELKRELIAKVASALSFIASESNDRVGAIFFSDTVEKWIAPGRGRVHVSKVIEKILTIKPRGSKTSITEALKFLIKLKHNAVVFMVSDFIDDDSNYSKYLKTAACKHDFIGMRIFDDCEIEIPDVGLLNVSDPESGEEFVLDTKNLSSFLNKRHFEIRHVFTKYKIDLLDLKTDKPFALDLVKFFRKRIRRSI